MKTTIKVHDNKIYVDNYHKEILLPVLLQSANLFLSDEMISEIAYEHDPLKYTEGVTKEYAVDIQVEGNSIEANFDKELSKEDMPFLVIAARLIFEEEEQEL